MNYLIVTKYYFPAKGGIEKVVLDHATFLNKNGYNVTVLCVSLSNMSKTQFENIEGINVLRCNKIFTLFSMPFSISFLWHFLKLKNISNVVHFHFPFPLLFVLTPFLIKSNNISYRITWHCDVFKLNGLSFLWDFLSYKFLNKMDRIFTSSEFLINESVLKRFKNVEILPLGIYINEYMVKKPSRLINSEYILFFGRLANYKGLGILFEMLENYDLPLNVKIVIAGNGNKKYEDRARKISSVIFLNSNINEAVKMNLFNHCLFYLFPSTSKAEAFGITQLEAMVCKKAIINTRLGTAVEYVGLDCENAITIEPNNPKALYNAICKLLKERDYAEYLGRNGFRRLIKFFDNDTNLRSLLE